MSKFFSVGVEPIWKGCVVTESNREARKIVSPSKNGEYRESVTAADVAMSRFTHEANSIMLYQVWQLRIKSMNEKMII